MVERKAVDQAIDALALMFGWDRCWWSLAGERALHPVIYHLDYTTPYPHVFSGSRQLPLVAGALPFGNQGALLGCGENGSSNSNSRPHNQSDLQYVTFPPAPIGSSWSS